MLYKKETIYTFWSPCITFPGRICWMTTPRHTFETSPRQRLQQFRDIIARTRYSELQRLRSPSLSSALSVSLSFRVAMLKASLEIQQSDQYQSSTRKGGPAGGKGGRGRIGWGEFSPRPATLTGISFEYPSVFRRWESYLFFFFIYDSFHGK